MKTLRVVLVVTLMLLTSATVMAQDDPQQEEQGNQQQQTTGVLIHGNVYGGGNQAEVKTNTEVNMSTGTVEGNVYGGGNLGDVGTHADQNPASVGNYDWKDQDGSVITSNTAENKLTGVCKVTITGGTVGVDVNSTANHASGHVFGAGKGLDDTWWCEKAMAFASNVSISAGTVYGNVYGGGQLGRVEDDAKVVIGSAGTPASGTEGEEGYVAAVPASGPDIKGDVFGAGAGIETHGYSALVRGNAVVTVQGIAQVGGSVYGGGEIASVGRFVVVGGLPTKPQSGGTCIVNIKDNATIGTSGTSHNVFGACKGVAPHYDENNYKSVYSMQLLTNAPEDNTLWDHYDGNENSPFILRYYKTEQDYLDFLKTLALTSNPHVTIGGTWTPNETTGTISASGTPSIFGSVYGGGQRGVTLGAVDVNMVGGTVEQDVYGGGALADTNLGNWDVNNYEAATAQNEGESITDLYTRTGAGTATDPYKYTKVTNETATFSSGTYYRRVPTWAHDEGSAYYKTTVDLTGGLIKGDAYGGGLGQKIGFKDDQGNTATKDIEAVVWGDIAVTLGSNGGASATAFNISHYDGIHVDVVKSGRVFGCNNLNGSPQGDVKVTVYRTARSKNSEGNDIARTVITRNEQGEITSVSTPHVYDLAAVYGGGNLANYTATGKKASVIIWTCEVSVHSVYGGGNAAEVPETDVLVRGAYEIEEVFGGGNGKDSYTTDGGTAWVVNPGANVNGNATTLLTGGYIHEAYGGSNSKGTISGNVSIDKSSGGDCTLKVEDLYGAGKDADIEGDLIMVMGCSTTRTENIYGCSKNANVKGNVELTITSGEYGKVFGGNNQSGSIFGHIIVNIEEVGCSPIIIDELYLGGNNAAYSVYGYYHAKQYTDDKGGLFLDADKTIPLYKDGNNYYKDEAKTIPLYKADNELLYINQDKTRALYMPRQSANDTNPIVTFEGKPHTVPDVTTGQYDDPQLNIISCTRIGMVFGGGLGTGATLYGNPSVNINMIPGVKASAMTTNETYNSIHLGEIGTVYGGGYAADVIGNPTVNIGTLSSVDEIVWNNTNDEPVYESDGKTPSTTSKTVVGAYITGNVYGGGKGEADNFLCDKAMIGKNNDGIANPTGGTTVNIYNGFVRGNVYGGGQIGRVEKNTVVTIGTGDGVAPGGTVTSAPIIMGSVYGGGAGEEKHGYAALVRGNPTVTIQGNAKVRHSVYGGGEIASVARYKVPQTEKEVEDAIAEGYTEAVLGMPYALKDPNSGTCTVTVQGYAEIGPETPMQMTKAGGPDDTGYVFGAGKGILPGGEYEFDKGTTRRMVLYDAAVHTTVGQQGSKWQWVDPAHSDTNKNVWEYFDDLDEYIRFIQTLALSSRTDVTITGNAFVKGSVYGGSENGIVQFNTDVKIQGGQIGAGDGMTEPYKETDWAGTTTPTNGWKECASWTFVEPYAPYDPYATTQYEGKYYYDTNHTQEAAGGASVATDGHTYYGNVFGGGSGSVPYFDHTLGRSVYLHSAGQVKGNTNVTISGGHILTNVYGGNEATNVDGTANVTMRGGTVGVPRTDVQIIAHPLTGYIFGGGKGDQRVFFNKDTNVKDAVVTIEGGRVYGSVYGGGEDGHVMRNVTLTIGKQTTTGEGENAVTTTSGPKIGTKGTSYYDGHVFGGGRGFGGDALTAGNVGGSVDVNILDGEILGSVYGGGRLASVGYGLYLTTENGYGEMRADNEYDGSYTNPSTEEAGDFFTKGRGHINITISGGTIGNEDEYAYDASNPISHTKGGNVFAGGMGRMYELDGMTPVSSLDWWKLGNVKSTKLTISGNAIIKSCVYGGGELGMVQGGNHTSADSKTVSTEIIINGGTIGTEVTEKVNNVDVPQYTFGSVFGGGYGSLTEKLDHTRSTNPTYSTYKYTYPKYIAGRVKGSTEVTMTGGTVLASVYGGGEMAAVGESKVLSTSTDPVVLGETLTGNNGAPIEANTYVTISGGTIGKEKVGTTYFGGSKMGNVYGGGSGDNNTVRSGHVYGNTNVTISDSPIIYHNVYGGGAYGTVGDFDYYVDEEQVIVNNETVTVKKVSGIKELKTSGTGTATVSISGGTIGIDGKENGMVFGSSRGDINQPEERDDHTAWVYNANVTIGTAATPAQGNEGEEGYVPATDASGPEIKGSVYGSGENGHTFNNTVVTVNGGKIGIDDSSDPGYKVTSNGKEYSGAAYPYRGNVYGGGCGTDKYYHDPTLITGTHTANDGEGDYYNPLAGIVYGTTTVNINGGTVVRNVYGAGAMGSVGKTDWTKTTTTENNVETTTKTAATTTGGSTTVNINGGIIGATGTVGDGNVFGAARGAKDIVQTDQDDLSKVSVTNVTVSGGEVKGNVYGGGELGDVGTIVKKYDNVNKNYIYTWMKSNGTGVNASLNNGIATADNTNTGICNVTITGGTIGSTTAGTGNVFGGGKGDANTWWCEKAMAFATKVSISEASGSTTKVYGTVYGGGEIGRVEDDSKVIIGTENGEDTPEIVGNVFGAGKGLATRGYSALVRGNSVVTIQGKTLVGGSVFGGGEEASLGRFELVKGLPKSPLTGGNATVTIQDNANIGSSGTNHHVYGAGQGVAPNYVTDPTNPNKYKDYKSMQLEGNKPDGNEGDTWDYYIDDDNKKDTRFVWVYYKSESAYQSFLNTLAITSHPVVTIAEKATVYGDVYGGGQRGITLGRVDVNITGGTVKRDVYGGGSLADTNKGNWDDDRYVAATVSAGASVAGLYTQTIVNNEPVYTPTANDATAEANTPYYRKGTWAEGRSASTFTTNVSLTGGEIDRNVYGGGLGQLAKNAVDAVGSEGESGYVPAQAAVSAVEAKVYGDVSVKLNEPTTSEGNTIYGDCDVKGTIFGCNNLNGSPQNNVTVHVWKTVHKENGAVQAKPTTKNDTTYELEAVYGGGNLAAYYPDDLTARESAVANVIIDGCNLTSIGSVYGGGNAASVPATEVLVNGTYEIGTVFGGGNGADEYILDDKTYENPGANVGYQNYTAHTWNATSGKYEVTTNSDASTLAGRQTYAYGIGKAHATILGGTVHKVYGGSDTRGNVRVEARATLNDGQECTFDVGEAYGGGNNAMMDGNAILDIDCISGLGIAYGGASNADVNGDVVLNIVNGTYGQVFGGNDQGGAIRGAITVNINETGCRPVIIGELYAGGNQAAYSVYGYDIDANGKPQPLTELPQGATKQADPQLNVYSFTSIGNIFGGGYGANAKMVASPHVNINVYEGKYATTYNNKNNEIAEGSEVFGKPVPSHKSGAIGAINNVYGGGNEAEVIGNPTVNIGTLTGDKLYEEVAVAADASVAGKFTFTAATGTAAENTTYYKKNGGVYEEVKVATGADVKGYYTKAEATGTAAENTTYYEEKIIKGVDIRGNVFGGGNNAAVTGDTNIFIGKKKE